jgi:cob(I)alamin adenosyltransferase
MAKLYTRRGDSGDTDGAGGRARKDAVAIEAVGALDETNAILGAAVSSLAVDAATAPLAEVLRIAQGDLFALGAAIAAPNSAVGLSAERVTWLEAQIDATDRELPPLRQFVLPGGSPPAAALHLARTVCRRAERRLVTQARDGLVPDTGLAYLNRLSDLLFAYARVANQAAGVDDVPWNSGA